MRFFRNNFRDHQVVPFQRSQRFFSEPDFQQFEHTLFTQTWHRQVFSRLILDENLPDNYSDKYFYQMCHLTVHLYNRRHTPASRRGLARCIQIFHIKSEASCVPLTRRSRFEKSLLYPNCDFMSKKGWRRFTKRAPICPRHAISEFLALYPK